MNTGQDGGSLIVSMASAEKVLGIGTTLLYALVNRGELTRVKIGRRSFITRKSLDDYFDRLIAPASAAE